MSFRSFLEAIGLERQPPPSDPIFRFKKFYEFTSFFRDLEARYGEALATAHQAITRELSTAGGDRPPPSAESLRLVCVSIPEAPPDAEWELSFEDPRGVHYTVSFRDWRPRRVEITP